MTVPELTITVVGFGYEAEWHIMINSLLAQTDDRWVAHLINDGPDKTARKVCESYPDPRLTYIETPERINDWGHSLRVLGLSLAETPLWATQNADNYVVPRYVELTVEAAAHADLVIFPCVHSYENVNRRGDPPYTVLNVAPRRNRCDAGTIVARTSLAQGVGWRSLDKNSDGDFIEDLMATAPRLATLPNVLMVHN